MKNLDSYILKNLGENIHLTPLAKDSLGNLPMFIGQIYKLYEANIKGRAILIAELKSEHEFSVLQISKHFETIKKAFRKEVVLVMEELVSYNRKRLIDKEIHFIIPGKQMYLPGLFIDLKERNQNTGITHKTTSLAPSSQFIILYHILNKDKKVSIENISFKNIAKYLGYTSMAITMAINVLKENNIVDVVGEKEKFIRFKLNKKELWSDLEKRNVLISPIIKKVYVDELPNGVYLKSDASALPQYTDLNPSKQAYFAIDKKEYYHLQKSNLLVNENNQDGKYCLEVWKYNPLLLAKLETTDMPVVDPLSLYLSLKNSQDERVKMGLEQIIKKYN